MNRTPLPPRSKPLKVLGLDLAKLTGIALVSDKGVEFAKELNFGAYRDKLKTGHNGHIFLALFEHISTMLITIPITHIIYERAHHRGGAASRIGVGMCSTVLCVSAREEVPVLDVHTLTLKKWATENAKAGKNAMIERASALAGRPIESDNAADAIMAAAYGLEVLQGQEVTQ